MTAWPAALDLGVRLLSEPCLWCWEVVDGRRGHPVLQSSWTSDWTAYGTAQEALAAGRVRLSELRTGPRDAHPANRRRGATAA